MRKQVLLVIIFSIFQWLFAQTPNDWKYQVTRYVDVASTPASANSYTWQKETIDFQGIHLDLEPTEITNIYVEAGNAKIDFCFWINGAASNILTYLDIEINNTGTENLYEGSVIYNYVWDCSNIFNQVGTYNLKVTYINMGPTIYNREYNIIVVPKSTTLFRDQYFNSMRLWKSTNPNAIPLILSSGFDAYNVSPEQYYRSAGASLFDCLLENGYDIYVLYYKYNPQDLRNNAAVYSSAINYISNTYYNSQNIIASGISMGGLISRYALAKAESLGNPLPVSTWISLDAPHQGAVISEDLQNYLNEHTDNSFDKYALECDAAKIMLNYNTYDTEGLMHSAFYSELSTLNGDGYPHLTNNIGVSFSNELPNPNSGIWLEIRTPAGAADKDITLSPEEKVAGSYLPELNIDPYIVTALWGAFWGTVTLTQISDPTFMPHNGSLDYDQNFNTPFDETIEPTVTSYHDQIPPEIINPILNALKYPRDLIIQNTNISGDSAFNARNSILAGNQVDPNQTNGDVTILPNSNVVFQAGNSIMLKNGFKANHNFIAKIGIPEPIVCNGDNIIAENVYNKIDKCKRSNSANYSYDDILNSTIHSSLPISYSENQEFSIFPNPVSTELYITFNNSIEKQSEIKIYSSLGNLVLKKTIDCINICKLDISSFPPGVYTILNQSCIASKPIKFIKQ